MKPQGRNRSKTAPQNQFQAQTTTTTTTTNPLHKETFDRESQDALQSNQQGFIHDHMSALADGIFAIAMTILVLEISTPETAEGVGTFIRQICLFALSFLVISNFYFERARLMAIVHHSNVPIITLDFVFFFGVCLIPLFTKFMFSYQDPRVSVPAYGVLVLIVAEIGMRMQQLVLRYHLVDSEYMDSAYTSDYAKQVMRRDFVMRTLWDAAAVIIAFFLPHVGIIMFIVIPVLQFVRRYRVGLYHARNGLKQPTIYHEIIQRSFMRQRRRRNDGDRG
ncbi:TMEM175 family protein [Alloscardovia criceti]|uniref:TMEM175 family protein n=1 Tax=Alloscardovia criceti TaxID=356828 RepID=UPI000365F9F1|nr:TMEM175 family protein [Alloscardovia criceti]